LCNVPSLPRTTCGCAGVVMCVCYVKRSHRQCSREFKRPRLFVFGGVVSSFCFAPKSYDKPKGLSSSCAITFKLRSHKPHNSTHMALPTTAAALEDDANWAVERATALPEFWALVAENGDGLVDAWRLMSVCRASRTGVKGWLGTLPGLVVCGGWSQGGEVGDVWRLDLATLRWEPMPALVTARSSHACCAVRHPRRPRWMNVRRRLLGSGNAFFRGVC
jgi:hypothetical protein